MLPPHGKYAVISGVSAERLLLPKILKELNQPVVVYGNPPDYLPRPYLLENRDTAEITLNTTVVCFGVRPPMKLLSNPMVGCVYVLEFPWVLLDQEKYNRVFVAPGVLPLTQKSAVFSALFRKELSYDIFSRYSYENPNGILSITGRGGDLKELR